MRVSVRLYVLWRRVFAGKRRCGKLLACRAAIVKRVIDIDAEKAICHGAGGNSQFIVY